MKENYYKALINRIEDKLNDTKKELTNTENELQIIANELKITKDELNRKTNELTRTENELQTTTNELKSANDKLENKILELTQAERDKNDAIQAKTEVLLNISKMDERTISVLCASINSLIEKIGANKITTEVLLTLSKAKNKPEMDKILDEILNNE